MLMAVVLYFAIDLTEQNDSRFIELLQIDIQTCNKQYSWYKNTFQNQIKEYVEYDGRFSQELSIFTESMAMDNHHLQTNLISNFNLLIDVYKVVEIENFVIVNLNMLTKYQILLNNAIDNAKRCNTKIKGNQFSSV